MEAARATGMLGKVLVTQGDYATAVPLLQQAVRVLGFERPSAELSEALGDLANAHYYLGHIEQSEAINLTSLALDRQVFGSAHPHTGIDLFNLGNIKLDRAKYSEAERLFRQSLTIARAWYGEDHPKTASATLMTGRAIAYQGRSVEAAGLYQRALTTMRAAYGPDHPRYAHVLSLMGDLAVERGDLGAAENRFRQAGQIFKRAFGEQHEFYLHQLSNLGLVLTHRKKYAAAETMLRATAERLEATVPEQRYTALAQVRLGAALAGQKRYREAVAFALSGYNALRQLMGADAVELLDARKELGEIYIALNQPAQAEALKAGQAAPHSPTVTARNVR
jgi:tetratricopeptide (TPR) repeat protein